MPHQSVEDFVRSNKGSSQLADAVKQQQDLAYFTQSSIQEEVTQSYLDAFTERKSSTGDVFLNYVKMVFRTDNALAFVKFMRHPLPSAELINDRIKEPLERVFHSDDSFFKYNIRGESLQSIPELNSRKFDKSIFNALLFGHNNIVVTTIVDINTPSRQIVDIDKVIAIDSHDSVINRIAYSAVFNGEVGYMYIDSTQYAFLNKKFELVGSVPHDLGECPADFVAEDAFGGDDVVRKSMFSYVKTALEEYDFLKILQRMTEPNGVIPVVTMLKARRKNDGKDTKSQSNAEPNAHDKMSSQQAGITSEITPSNNLMQAGTNIEVQMILKEDQSIDTDVVKNWFNFHHMPIEPLKYLNDRIKEVEKSIIISLLGNFSEQNEATKNELQVGLSFANKKDILRSFSGEISRIVTLSDFKYLALQHGKANVSTTSFYGSDFFTETQEQLYKQAKDSPNPIERNANLRKLARNRNQFNKEQGDRDEILYHLLPYSFNEDFEAANEKGITPVLFEYQTRFSYWIGFFEAKFGDIVTFWESLGDDSNSEKIILIDGLIKIIITEANKVEVVEDASDDSATKNAQAILRASVGGVTGAIAAVQNLPEEQAAEVLIEFFGFTRETALRIAKKPEVKEVKVEEINIDE